MKRILSVCLILILSVSLFACKGTQETATDSETPTETETPNEPEQTYDLSFSRYAVNGTYYAFLEAYENRDYNISFDTSARKMSIVNPEGKMTLCSYDESYYLTRIDFPSGSVITINTLTDDDRLPVKQSIHYSEAGVAVTDHILEYTYDKDHYLSSITYTDLTGNTASSATCIFSGNFTYLFKNDVDTSYYFHFNYFLYNMPFTNLQTDTTENEDLKVNFVIDPQGPQEYIFKKVTPEQCKMFNEYTRFNCLFFQFPNLF